MTNPRVQPFTYCIFSLIYFRGFWVPEHQLIPLSCHRLRDIVSSDLITGGSSKVQYFRQVSLGSGQGLLLSSLFCRPPRIRSQPTNHLILPRTTQHNTSPNTVSLTTTLETRHRVPVVGSPSTCTPPSPLTLSLHFAFSFLLSNGQIIRVLIQPNPSPHRHRHRHQGITLGFSFLLFPCPNDRTAGRECMLACRSLTTKYSTIFVAWTGITHTNDIRTSQKAKDTLPCLRIPCRHTSQTYIWDSLSFCFGGSGWGYLKLPCVCSHRNTLGIAGFNCSFARGWIYNFSCRHFLGVKTHLIMTSVSRRALESVGKLEVS